MAGDGGASPVDRLLERLVLLARRGWREALRAGDDEGMPRSPRQRLLLVGIVVLAGAAALAAALRRAWRRGAAALPQPALIPLSALLRLLADRRVQEIIYREGGALSVRLKGEAMADGVSLGSLFVSHLVPGSEAELFRRATEAEVSSVRYVPTSQTRAQALSWLAVFAMFGLWYRMAKSLVSRDEKFVQDRRKPREATTFADVISRSKVELQEIVDYLNHPGKYRSAGARLPRGALLVGPSGTGKTLLARAVAGEARCTFISASASEFVEVFVGRGAARVRDLFRQARAQAPAVLFIDELDSLGSRRGPSAARGANEECVQTLNQLLTELDGFHGRADGVVVLGATNRREAVDTALLRPGRFDRHVLVELPNEEERLAILRLHASRAPSARAFLKTDQDSNCADDCGDGPATLAEVAREASGLSGAELANIVNEAIFLGMREGRRQARPQDLRAALARARASKEGAAQPGVSPTFLAPGFTPFLRGWPAAAAA